MERPFGAAFPGSRAEAVAAATAAMPAAEHDPVGDIAVAVEGENLRIPYRIYNPEPCDAAVLGDCGAAQVLACLYTRHHDGHVRQRHLRQIIDSTESWVTPFVVQLIGEYVIEIVIEIRDRLIGLNFEGSPQRAQYGAFVAENGAYVERIAQRVVSYWDCYYRHQYPELAAYPGSQLLTALRRAGREHPLEGRS